MVEVKPLSQTKKPRKGKKTEYQYKMEMFEYIKNCSKWSAAMKWCESRNMEFMILTENNVIPHKSVELLLEDFNRKKK